MYKNSKPVLDINDYPTIKFLNGMGIDLSLPPEKVKSAIYCLSDYQLKIYHHDVMRRPFNMYDIQGVRYDIYNNLLNEKTTIDNMDYEIVSDKEYKARKKESRFYKRTLPLMIMALVYAIVALVSVLDMYLSVKGGF